MQFKVTGGAVSTFDYENPKHVENVANLAAKHRDFNKIPDAAQHLSDALSQGSYKFIEDPRIQLAIKKAGHSGYFISGKEGKQQVVRKASGGSIMGMAGGGGIKPYDFNVAKNSTIVEIPGVGPTHVYWDHANKRVVVSDEGYWNPKSPTGDALNKAVQWARDMGYQAGVVVSPYASDRFGDGITTTAGNHTRSMPGATDDQLRAYVDAADFVVVDPYAVSAASATPDVLNNFASFTKNVGNYAESKGKDSWLVLQGFTSPDVDPNVVSEYNQRLINGNSRNASLSLAPGLSMPQVLGAKNTVRQSIYQQVK